MTVGVDDDFATLLNFADAKMQPVECVKVYGGQL